MYKKIIFFISYIGAHEYIRNDIPFSVDFIHSFMYLK